MPTSQANLEASRKSAEMLIAEPDFRSRRHHHIERAIRLGAFVLIGQGVLWCIILGISNVPVGIALHSCFVAGGFALLYLSAIGAWRATLHTAFWLLFAYCIGVLLFFDAGEWPWPRVTHLYLLPIALATNLIFMDEHPFWRIFYTAICIVVFVIVEREMLPIPTFVVIPNSHYITAFGSPFNTAVAVALTFISLRRFANDVAVREDRLSTANSAIESLLERMLPHKVLQRLREEGSTFAEDHHNVSILFADIVGFTQLASRVDPQELVNLLNEIFSRFDQLVERHGVEKIKTIGDAYMAVAGIPEPRADHALALARLAKDMLKVIADYPQLKIRIGINSGHVVAGIIGRKRFIYDLWGDAVNLAASMEALGVPSRIHVSENTANGLKAHYELECRGNLDMKGRGSFPTYFVGEAKSGPQNG